MSLELDVITYIESQHEYNKINLVNSKPVMTMGSSKTIADQLHTDMSMRIHRSFTVNLKKVSTIERNRIVFDGKINIPVSDQYINLFQEYIEKNFLS